MELNSLRSWKLKWKLCASRRTILATVLFVLVAVGCRRTDQPIAIRGEAQGSYYSILYYDAEERHFDQAIDSLFKAFDNEVSLWVEHSLLRRVNDNRDSVVTSLFADILQKSIDMNRYTDGAFDCRIGRLVQMWGFSFRHRTLVDADSMALLLAAARQPVTLRNDGDRCVLQKAPETELDFNAIAQGYMSDLIGEYLTAQGIENFLVDVGGEVLAHGSKPDGSAWRVGIERPAEERYSQQEVALAIALRDRSVVTSGSYRKFYERDGVRYSHTIDPTTGYPVTHSLLSVSVVDSTAWRADALATAFMVMGVDSALRFIAQHEPTLPVLFIYDEQGTQRCQSTPSFDSLVIE